MIKAKAVAKYVRISPRKVRLVTRPLKGMEVATAFAFLRNTNKRAAGIIDNVLKSAFDNARKKDKNLTESDFYISRVTADSGPALRRFRAASMGRASLVKKRMSHITVLIEAKKTVTETKKKTTDKKPALFKKGRTIKKPVRKPGSAKSATATRSGSGSGR